MWNSIHMECLGNDSSKTLCPTITDEAYDHLTAIGVDGTQLDPVDAFDTDMSLVDDTEHVTGRCGLTKCRFGARQFAQT